jgi:hypothetical protein
VFLTVALCQLAHETHTESVGYADCLPDKDDDGGRLGHGTNHATHTHHTQEGEEGFLAARTGAFSGNHGGILWGDGGEACTAREILKGKCSGL